MPEGEVLSPEAEVLGQEHLKEMLSRALGGGRLAHALLFTGAAGLGKGALARDLARAVSCDNEESRAAGRGCGRCLSCRQVDLGVHPDVREISPSPRSIRLEQVREMIREAHLRPVRRRRVFVVKEADRLTEEAANALLKVLEEPPGQALFLLTAVRAGAVLSTVRSRCQLLPLRPVDRQSLASHLQSREGLAPEEARAIALLTGGNPGRARVLAAGRGIGEARDLMGRVMATVGEERLNPLEAAALAAELVEFQIGEGEGSKGVQALEFLSWACRDLLVRGLAGEGEPALLPQGDMPPPIAGADKLLDALAEVEKARTALERNANRRLVFEVLLIKLHALLGENYN